MTTYAYLRVSTEDQDHGVDAQRAAIDRVLKIDEWFEERASGKSMDGRPVLTALVDRVCDEKATLVVSKLDRLSRSVLDVLTIHERLKVCGASIKMLDMGIDTSTPVGEMMLTTIAGFAQYERRMIGERTKAGLAAARDKGVQLGRPRLIDRRPVLDMLDSGEAVERIAVLTGCSVRTVQRIQAEAAHGWTSGSTARSS